MSADDVATAELEGADAPLGQTGRRATWPGVLLRFAFTVAAAVIVVVASFMEWISVELPAGRSGETTGWELGEIEFATDAHSFDPQTVEGPTFASVDQAAQALTAGGFLCAVLRDPAGVPVDAPFVDRGACGPLPGSASGAPPEQVFAESTPKFTVSVTPGDNEIVVDGFLAAIERADAGPGLRGYRLVLVGPNWSMSSPREEELLDAQSAIGGTLLSTSVETNRFFVADLFDRGFFTGVTTVLLGAFTALVGVVFLVAAAIASRRKRPIPAITIALALLGVAGLVGAVAFDWFSWITRGDGYDDVDLETGFYVLTIGAVLGVAVLAAIVTSPRIFRPRPSPASPVPADSADAPAPASPAAPAAAPPSVPGPAAPASPDSPD